MALNNNPGKLQDVFLQRVDNEPVIGANIVVTGTTIGTITDVEGRFSLDNLPAMPVRLPYLCWHDFANASDQIRDDDTSGG